LVKVAAWASSFVTTTVAVPTAWTGVTAVIDVAVATATPVAAVPPIVTIAPDRKPVPAIVTLVFPAEVPLAGEMLVTVGAV
jgi:hypothetical protein